MAGLFQRVGSFFGGLGSALFGGSRSLPPVPTQAQLLDVLGPPREPNLACDEIVQDIVMVPYRGPLDLDNYGGETWQMRERYRRQYRESPVVRAAMLGKNAAISCLDVTVLPGDEHDPRSVELAEFTDWTIQNAPGGWPKVIEDVHDSATVDGWSVCEKKLKPVHWHGKDLWGFDHTRQLDSQFVRLQLDVYRNVVSVVNMVRGLEYYDPRQVIIYTHNGMYNNPFGQSDIRAATLAANLIEDAYKVWYVAIKVYGLPYMVAKYKSGTQKDALSQAMRGLREYGYIVIDKEDEIDVLNMASAAGMNGFQDFVHTQREDAFFSIRGAAQPFMEGDGGADAHTDTGVQKVSSDAIEVREANKTADVIRHQLFAWIAEPNYPSDVAIPKLRLGGTNWKETGTIVDVLSKAMDKGAEVSAPWFYQTTGIMPGREGNTLGAQRKGSMAEFLGTTAGLQALTGLQEKFYSGAIPQPAVVSAWRAITGCTEEQAISLFPPNMPVDRVSAAKQQAQGQQQPGGGAPPAQMSDVQTFSAGVEETWGTKINELLNEFRSAA